MTYLWRKKKREKKHLVWVTSLTVGGCVSRQHAGLAGISGMLAESMSFRTERLHNSVVLDRFSDVFWRAWSVWRTSARQIFRRSFYVLVNPFSNRYLTGNVCKGRKCWGLHGRPRSPVESVWAPEHSHFFVTSWLLTLQITWDLISKACVHPRWGWKLA